MKLNKKQKETLSIFSKNKILILAILYKCRDNICGCDIAKKIKTPKNLLSYHLKTLKKSDFITEKKCGKTKNFFINNKKLAKTKEILKILELI